MNVETTSIDSEKGSIKLYKLINNNGAYVELSSIGAGIISICVPDRNGKIEDVVLGYQNITDYIYDGPCAGKTAGRYANRIAKGHLMIEDKLYLLNCNCGGNSLHGGPEGFQNQNWDSEICDNKVIFTYLSRDGEENFPGNVNVKVSYEWTDENSLRIDFQGTTDTPTVLNLTNHTYFNLRCNGDILSHTLIMNCDKYLPTDDTLVPTGEYLSVKGTPMDFTFEKALGENINDDFEPLRIGKGYDHCWVVNRYEDKCLKDIAILKDNESGRELHISSTQVGVQVYTGNWLNDSPIGKEGMKYFDYCAVAIECQGLPDAPNKPHFPSQFLNPGEEYKETIIYTFKNTIDK